MRVWALCSVARLLQLGLCAVLCVLPACLPAGAVLSEGLAVMTGDLLCTRKAQALSPGDRLFVLLMVQCVWFNSAHCVRA